MKSKTAIANGTVEGVRDEELSVPYGRRQVVGARFLGRTKRIIYQADRGV
jgi:hypothetical protein